MMKGGSLPIWVIIQIISLALAIVGGVYAPYVSKVDKRIANKFIDGLDKESPPMIKIRTRWYYGYMALTMIVLTCVSIVSFMMEDFGPLVQWLGHGALGVIVAILCTLLIYVVIGAILILVAMYSVDKAKRDMQLHYERQGIKVEVEE